MLLFSSRFFKTGSANTVLVSSEDKATPLNPSAGLLLAGKFHWKNFKL